MKTFGLGNLPSPDGAGEGNLGLTSTVLEWGVGGWMGGWGYSIGLSRNLELFHAQS